ncbi:hypothetical protein CWI38_0117p0010, partial [Hamiltosporidium tvaerminnensis]
CFLCFNKKGKCKANYFTIIRGILIGFYIGIGGFLVYKNTLQNIFYNRKVKENPGLALTFILFSEMVNSLNNIDLNESIFLTYQNNFKVVGCVVMCVSILIGAIKHGRICGYMGIENVDVSEALFVLSLSFGVLVIDEIMKSDRKRNYSPENDDNDVPSKLCYSSEIYMNKIVEIQQENTNSEDIRDRIEKTGGLSVEESRNQKLPQSEVYSNVSNGLGILTKFFNTYGYAPEQNKNPEFEISVDSWDEKIFIDELNEMRGYVKTTNIGHPEFLDKIFNFSRKLILVERILFQSLTKSVIIKTMKKFGFEYFIIEILIDKNYVLLKDLIIFVYKYRDNFEIMLKDGLFFTVRIILNIMNDLIFSLSFFVIENLNVNFLSSILSFIKNIFDVSFGEIEKRKLHSKLYNARKNELVSVSDSSRWPRDEAVFCYIQDRNVFWGADDMYYLATRCEKMLGHDYTRRHNEVVRCLHLLLLNRYKFKSSKRIRSHSVQEILDNEYTEIRVDIRIKTDYDLLANDLGLIYKCSVEIISYMMTWDGIVTKYHKSHPKRLEIPMNVEAYIQSIVLKKTSALNAEESWERASMGTNIPLKEAKREEDGAKNFKPKNKEPLISQGGTTLEEPTNNINEESDLEEETIVVKEVEENI